MQSHYPPELLMQVLAQVGHSEWWFGKGCVFSVIFSDKGFGDVGRVWRENSTREDSCCPGS